MKTTLKTLTALIAVVMFTLALSGCSSSRSENGVMIEQKRNYKFW